MENKMIKKTDFIIKKTQELDEVGIVSGIANKVEIKDWYGDVIKAGAFDKTVDQKPTIPVLWNHYSFDPIGVAHLSLAEDKSLFATMKLNLKTLKGKEAYHLAKQFLKEGINLEVSIGFLAKEWKKDNETNIRTITEAKVFEVSLTPFAVNQESKITEVKTQKIKNQKDLELRKKLKILTL